MTHDGLSDAHETMNNNACIHTDIAALARCKGWSVIDVECEGFDASRLRDCPVCTAVFVTADFKGHCSDECKQQALWMDRRRAQRRATLYERKIRAGEF